MATFQLAKRKRTAIDWIAYALATGLGAGFAPIAPGTVGSLEGVVIFVAVLALHFGTSTSLLVLAVLNVVIFGVGVWAATRTCEITGRKDPRLIVIDEVSGQLIALTPLAQLPALSIVGLIAGFLLFRLFDIFKPYPIRKLERLHAGLGVVADDVLAGLYAAALLWVGHLARLI